MTTTNPFGTRITSDDIIETLGFFDSWEDRYKYIIDLGRELPPMAETARDEAHLVKGCQSQVWIDARLDNGRLYFETDSDAFIVKGLLAVVLAAYNGKRPDDVLAFAIEDYFQQLDLLRHLSPTRGNGLRAMVQRIRTMAEESATA